MTSQPLPDLDDFAAEARQWLSSVAAPRTRAKWGVGPDSVAVFENWTAEQERAETDRIRGYERAKYDAGWGALTWPEEYGGRGLPTSYALAFRQEEDAVRRAAAHRDVLGHPAGLGRRLRELDGGAGARRDRPDPRLRAGEVRRRLGCAHLVRGVRRPQPPDVVRTGLPAEEDTFDVPRRTEMFSVTQQLVAPAIAQWGTPEQRERYVRAMLRTDLIACQLFSETEAGSDLAAVRTRAVERDGHWVLDGHKVWTSGAPVADIGVAVTRTDPAVAKHAGLTVFLVPMDTPGVTVRPIRQMTGGSSFNEVYLDGVELTDDLRLGPVGQGWKVALTVLAAERLDSGNLGLANADRAVELARHLDRPLTELERDRVADL